MEVGFGQRIGVGFKVGFVVASVDTEAKFGVSGGATVEIFKIFFASEDFSGVGSGGPEVAATIVPGGVFDHLERESSGEIGGVGGVKCVDVVG